VNRETSVKRDNGNAVRRPKKRRKQTTPELSEKAKKLALKAFRMTYEAHHGKPS
jgi:hypothetical protein